MKKISNVVNPALELVKGTSRKRSLMMWIMSFLDLNRINAFYDKYIGGDDRPVFHDIGKTCHQLQTLTENYPIIREELLDLLQADVEIPNYHDLDPGQYEVSSGREKWKIFMLYLFGLKPEHNRKLCPKTTALIDNIPNVCQAFFSLLEPNKSVPAHYGPYRGFLRYHLGVIVSKNNPPLIRINKDIHIWQEGQAILFDDTWEHEVINCSETIRVILLVDIMRPMPIIPHFLNRLGFYLIKRTYGKIVMDNLKNLV